MESVSDSDAGQWANSVCSKVGQPVKILRPDAWKTDSVNPSRIKENADYIQLIHGVVISNADGQPSSLATIVLPRFWNTKPTNEYPIVAMSYYDLNHTTFRVPQGESLIDLVASSTSDDRSGAIGVIFNGNAGAIGYTNNVQAFRDFGTLINQLSTDFSGNRNSIVVFGGSRGGSSAINFATNPLDLDYKVVFASAGASATHAKRLMELVPSMTYPRTAEVVSEVAGFHDAWRPNWQYPDCGAEQYRGLPITDVLTDVIYGAAIDTINELTPYSNANIQRLLQNQTKVYMSIGRNDVLPPAAQMDFALKMLSNGVAAEVSTVSRGGHGGLRDTTERAKRALLSLLDNEPLSLNTGLHHYIADHNSGEYAALSIADNTYPFTMEAPRAVIRGHSAAWVFSGTPGTEYRARVIAPAGLNKPAVEVAGSIPMEEDNIFSVESLTIPADYSGGDYSYELEIKKPGGDWQSISSTNTPAPNAVEAILTVEEELPNISGETLSRLIEDMIPDHPETIGGTGWGLSEY